jgi:hypothetical protein
MRVPMPSPNRTNYENLFLDHQRLLPPVAAYDSIDGNLTPDDLGAIEKVLALLKAKGLSDDELTEIRRMLDGGMSMDDFPRPGPQQQRFAQDAYFADPKTRDYYRRFPEAARIGNLG